MTDGTELYPSSGDISESEEDIPQIPGNNPLEVGDNVWRMDSTLDSLDPRFGVLLSGRIRFPQHSGVGLAPTEMDCVNLFIHQSLISHVLALTKDSIVMKIWIGVMFAKTLSPLSNIEYLWKEEGNGFVPAH